MKPVSSLNVFCKISESQDSPLLEGSLACYGQEAECLLHDPLLDAARAAPSILPGRAPTSPCQYAFASLRRGALPEGCSDWRAPSAETPPHRREGRDVLGAPGRPAPRGALAPVTLSSLFLLRCCWCWLCVCVLPALLAANCLAD